MKRVFALVLAVMVMASLSVVAFADATHQTSGDGKVDKQSSKEVEQIDVETPTTSGEVLRVDDNEDDINLLEKLVDNTSDSQKLAVNQRAPYVFNVGVYNTVDNSMANGVYYTVTLKNINIPKGYTFEYVLYYNGTKWSRGSSTSGITGTMPSSTTLVLTNHLPNTEWNTDGGSIAAGSYTGIPIAVVVRTTGSGSGSDDTPVVPVSPQTGEIGSSVYLLGAAVMAAACAAFVVKSRKAA